MKHHSRNEFHGAFTLVADVILLEFCLLLEKITSILSYSTVCAHKGLHVIMD